MDQYIIIVALAACIVISYFFNEISKRTNVPSVLMLIVAGVLFGKLLEHYPSYKMDFMPYLGILGTVGLIMIVLEGALDLELSKEKKGLIIRATVIGLPRNHRQHGTDSTHFFIFFWIWNGRLPCCTQRRWQSFQVQL